MALLAWALPRLSQLLPIDEDSLKQIITYTDTLSKPSAAEHLKNLLGDSPQALEFISSFNTRRTAPPADAPAGLIPVSHNSRPATAPSSRDVSESEVPKTTPRPRKKKQDFNRLPPVRRPNDYGNVAGGYVKKGDEDYMTERPRSRSRMEEPALADTLVLQSQPDAIQQPTVAQVETSTRLQKQAMKLPPSAAGTLISDTIPSRSASPSKGSTSTTKVSIAGGTSMRGASTVLQDLDSAIRSLEIQTNPTLASQVSAVDNARRRCNCMAQRHPLLAAAPNCLNCGKIVCVKEGLGPCTFCERPLLSSEEIQAMVRVLKEERGRERMEVNNSAHKRAEVARQPRPFAASSSALNTPVSSSAPSSDSESEQSRSLAAAKQHRDRLLKFQAENARRTRIHDEAADFETPDAGTNMWASPQERALQLKRQQKVMREQEWSARPEWEKKRVVVSIDVSSGKAMRKMQSIERPPEMDESDTDGFNGEESSPNDSFNNPEASRGTFARNPLLAGLIRPTYRNQDPGKDKANSVNDRQSSIWRRVQDDINNNEQWILDGGAYGGSTDGRVLGAEEHSHG